MAWTIPKTFVANTAITASELNTHIRDNLLETEAALATDQGYFVDSGLNSISKRHILRHALGGTVTTTSSSYVDLGGPSLTFESNGAFLASWSVRHSGGGFEAFASINVSGSNGPSDTFSCRRKDQVQTFTTHAHIWHFNQPTGEITVDLRYRRSNSGTAEFSNRQLTIIPL